MIEYIEITDNFKEELDKIDSQFYQLALEQYLHQWNKNYETKEIRLIFYSEFLSSKYELYFDFVRDDYEIKLGNMKEIDSYMKVQHIKNLFDWVILNFQNYSNKKLENENLFITRKFCDSYILSHKLLSDEDNNIDNEDDSDFTSMGLKIKKIDTKKELENFKNEFNTLKKESENDKKMIIILNGEISMLNNESRIFID